jgi:hypothetical protein
MPLKLIEDMVDRALSNMTSEERRDLILSVVDRMLGRMEASERLTLMEHVVDRFLEGLPAEERQSTVRELVPRLMAQLLQSGGMSVDDLLWAAMGSLGALEKAEIENSGETIQNPNAQRAPEIQNP